MANIIIRQMQEYSTKGNHVVSLDKKQGPEKHETKRLRHFGNVSGQRIRMRKQNCFMSLARFLFFTPICVTIV